MVAVCGVGWVSRVHGGVSALNSQDFVALRLHITEFELELVAVAGGPCKLKSSHSKPP